MFSSILAILSTWDKINNTEKKIKIHVCSFIFGEKYQAQLILDMILIYTYIKQLNNISSLSNHY